MTFEEHLMELIMTRGGVRPAPMVITLMKEAYQVGYEEGQKHPLPTTLDPMKKNIGRDF